jgi:1-acyl-sn-glycerol-3-phosphate acyltransferase
MPFVYRLTRNCFKGFAKLLYRHRVYGTEHLPTGPAILAPNHASFWDPPLVAASAPGEITFLARASLFEHPLFGIYIRRLNAYPVQGNAQDLASIKLICRLLQENKQVVIFPEGNRTWDGILGPFKSGISMLALRTQCPIVPVYLYGTYRVWSRQRRFPRLYGHTACVFGTPIPWEPYANLPKKEGQEAMAQAVRDAIIALRSWYEAGAQGSPP